MIGRRIGYLLLLATGVYFIMLYDFQGLRFLLCCVICLPLASLLMLVPKAFLCRVAVGAQESFVTRGNTANIRIIVENKGLLPVSRVRMAIRWKASGEKEITVRKWLYGFGRGRNEVVLEFFASHCGEAQIVITKAGICDYFGIFMLPVKRVGTVKFCITPIITPIVPDEIEASAFYVKASNGEQEGDVTLREYQPGDNLQRVYWKLAAKIEDLQVRELEQNDSITLYLNYSDAFREQADKWDQYLDMASSVLCFLEEESAALRNKLVVVWKQGNGYRKCEIDSIEALQGWVCALLQQKEIGLLIAEEEIFFLEQGCHLKEDCKLYLGEQCVYE